MTLQAEIQKRQRSVSDLKRQVEQIIAPADDDKKAGIRVADALRKRKLRASLKDVKIRDPADIDRRLANSADIYSFLSCYFPDVFWGDWTDQRREMVAAILNAARYGGDQAIAAPRGEGKTSIVQCVTIYCVMHSILSFPLIAATSRAKAQAFVTACRILRRRLPLSAGRGPQSVTRESLDAEISAAKAWLDAHPATTGSGSGRVRYLSMENFRG